MIEQGSKGAVRWPCCFLTQSLQGMCQIQQMLEWRRSHEVWCREGLSWRRDTSPWSREQCFLLQTSPDFYLSCNGYPHVGWKRCQSPDLPERWPCCLQGARRTSWILKWLKITRLSYFHTLEFSFSRPRILVSCNAGCSVSDLKSLRSLLILLSKTTHAAEHQTLGTKMNISAHITAQHPRHKIPPPQHKQHSRK